MVWAAASARARPLRRVQRQRGGLLQERGRRGQAAARLRPAGRAFELGGDVLVRPGCGLRPVPGPPVGIELRIGGLGQGPVRLPPLLGDADW